MSRMQLILGSSTLKGRRDEDNVLVRSCRNRPALAWSLGAAIAMALHFAAPATASSSYDLRLEELAKQLEARPRNRELKASALHRSQSLTSQNAAAEIRRQLERQDLLLVRVPGLFYRSHPHTGADLRVVEDWVGARVPMVPVEETATVEAAAAQLGSFLRTHTRDGKRAVLISASKGSADVRVALESDPTLARHVAGWIDLVGVLEGTPLTDPEAPAREVAARWLPGETADSLSRRVRRAAAAPDRFPAEVATIHVAAFPRESEISDAARAGFEALRAEGPNDGYVMLDALLRAPGRVWLARGIDHYLGHYDLQRPLTALLLELLDEIAANSGSATQPAL